MKRLAMRRGAQTEEGVWADRGVGWKKLLVIKIGRLMFWPVEFEDCLDEVWIQNSKFGLARKIEVLALRWLSIEFMDTCMIVEEKHALGELSTTLLSRERWRDSPEGPLFDYSMLLPRTAHGAVNRPQLLEPRTANCPRLWQRIYIPHTQFTL